MWSDINTWWNAYNKKTHKPIAVSWLNEKYYKVQNISNFLPIHVTFKHVSKKWQETCAYIQSDNVNFISHDTDNIRKDLKVSI
jgi:hypothetical protein